MKKLSSWAVAYMTPLFVLLVTITVLMIGASDAWAYTQYSINRDATNCRTCHGDFRSSPYISPSGDVWTDDLHDVHRGTMVSSDCNTCHGSPFFPVSLDSSNGGVGLQAISCVGCHGREQDMGNDSVSPGRGAGLRQHHTIVGVQVCADCHDDAMLASYVPVGENVFPDYYADPATTEHPDIPTDPCNPAGEEGVYGGNLLGLDNDGDGIYDTADPDCTNTPPVADPNGPYSGTAGSPMQFDGSGSFDSDGTIVAYDWDFGDGSSGTGVNPSHTYAANGTYTVSLTVTDDDGASDTATSSATISVPDELDLDLVSLKPTKKVSLKRMKPVVLKLVVQNFGTVEGSALTTITGMQNGVEVYNETLTVTDPVGNGRTTYDNSSVPAILPFAPTAAGDILWRVTIDDDDPDIDEATAVTTVTP